MVKLTVMYTLPEGADPEAFLEWRTTEHQRENMGIPGVIKSDFYAVREIYTHGSEGDKRIHEKESETGSKAQEQTSEDRLRAYPRIYRYITEAYWPDMESFRSAFFDSGYQKRLMDSLQKIANPLFLISKEVLSEEK
jgi:hypothetical protein